MFENIAPPTLDLTDSFNKTNCEIKPIGCSNHASFGS